MPGSRPNESKFRRAFDAHFNAINRYCLRRVPLEEVNDVVAEVFTVAWRKIDQMPESGRELPWLYAVARNEVRNRLRSRRRRAALNGRIRSQAGSADPGPELVVVAHAEYAELMAALATLGPDDQELLLLRTHEDLDYAEIAAVVGSTPEAVRKKLFRALQRLRRAAGIPKPGSEAIGSRAIQEGGDK